MISHALSVRLEAEPGKEGEVALGAFEFGRVHARRLAKSLMCVSLLLASAAATADVPPVTTQVVDLANKLSGGFHPGFRAFHAMADPVERRLAIIPPHTGG